MYHMRLCRFLFLFIIGLSSFTSAIFAEPWILEGKAGTYFPLSSRMRKIFTTMPFVEVEGRYRMCNCWEVWGQVGGIFGEGNSLGCGAKTAVQVFPFAFGASFIFKPTCELEAYLGLGGAWSLYNNQDHSSSVIGSIHGNAFGGILKGGARYQLWDSVSISVFTEYLYQQFSFHRVDENHFTYRNDVNMSGIKLGMGIGYQF